MSEQPTRKTAHRAGPSGNGIRVTATAVLVSKPAVIVPDPNAQSEGLTHKGFEDAIDKASRPVKGKYADILPSSERFIQEKQKEVELEERSS